MTKKVLRYLTALLCAVMVGVVAIGNINVSAAMPSSLDAPKNLTVAYAFDYWRQSPSSLELNWKNPSSIKKLAEAGEVNISAQIDWKLGKDDDWKYSESWDRMEKRLRTVIGSISRMAGDLTKTTGIIEFSVLKTKKTAIIVMQESDIKMSFLRAVLQNIQ